MLKENTVVRDKTYNMISNVLVEKYLLQKIKLNRDVDDLKKEFRIFEDVYYYMKRKTEQEMKNIADGGNFLNFFYSVLFGVLDVGEELLARLEGVIEKSEQ